jgi:phosphoribosylamine-glycine ligase
MEYAAYNAYEAVESIRYPSKILRRDIARNVAPAEALQSKA